MSLIERITRLKHPGVLRDVTWPTDLPTFARFNLIYGWNGSGKTTLSRLFRYIEQRSAPPTGEATLRIDGSDVDGRDFPHATTAVRVFNRDFINESVFPLGGGDVPPIFVVGKESIEKHKEADRLKTERSTKEAALARARSTKDETERDLDKHCTDEARIIKETLRVPGPGAYNEYDKRAYRTRSQQMVEARDAESLRLGEAARDSFLIQHTATIKPPVPEITYRLPAPQQLREEVAAVLATTVASSTLQALKDDPEVGDWVRRGLALHKNRPTHSCLFCEQPLPEGRLTRLEAHFSLEYTLFLRRLSESLERLRAVRRQARELRLPDRAALYEDMMADYDSAERGLRRALETLGEFIDALLHSLEEKTGQPFRSVELHAAVPDIGADVLDGLNAVLRRHNQACDNFQSRAIRARDQLALDRIAQSLSGYSRLAEAAKGASAAIAQLQEDIQRLTGEIERLERDIVEHRQPAEELNEDLRKYLGHGELRLDVRDTGYVLTRHGVPADSLSEGERTALALLYFLKSLRDRRFDLRQGVVVLDDPVSSLDANALYLAFGFIRQRTQDAAQLFLLTHNFSFFRQVRSWFHHLKGQKKKDISQRPARFYMLDRIRAAGPRSTTVRPLDPLLEQYESEYHYLFAYVHREADAATDASLEQNYGLPNIARRLLEMFLAFRRPQVAGELWQKMKDAEFDEVKKIRILRFVHTHSHGDTVGEPEHDPFLLGEARSVLVDLLEFIKAQDPTHFEAMVAVVGSAGSSENSE